MCKHKQRCACISQNADHLQDGALLSGLSSQPLPINVRPFHTSQKMSWGKISAISPFCQLVYTQWWRRTRQLKFISVAWTKNHRPAFFLQHRIRATRYSSNNVSQCELNLPFTCREKVRYFGVNFCTILYLDFSVYEPRPIRTVGHVVASHNTSEDSHCHGRRAPDTLDVWLKPSFSLKHSNCQIK